MENLIFGLTFFSVGLFIGWLISRLKLREAEHKVALMEKMQASFGEQLKGISADALKQNNESFLQLAEHSLEKNVKPVRESLEKFDGKLQELEKARTGAYAGLREQVQNLLQTQKELRLETANLSKALRAPSVRGRWGEMQLKRVVEMAGMVDHCDFFEQTTVSTEERRFRPDLLVKLPGKKNIVVDAKAPLSAYLDAVESQDEKERLGKMKEHASHIRNHMALLSRKSYWEQFQPSPEFVILFLPGETFFSAALEQDPSLIEAGVDQKVILATPTTLIALLRAVAYGWRQESLSRNAEQISALGRELYKRVRDMSGHWTKVGKGLTNAVQAYNQATGSLESRVLVSARRFVDWGEEKEIEPIEPIEHTTRILKSEKALDNTQQDD